MALGTDGDREMPFRSDGFEPVESPWERPSTFSRLATVVIWLVTGATIVVLAAVAGVFILFAAEGEPADITLPDSPEGQRILAESVELEGCRYVGRMAERVTVRFTNRFDQRVDRVVIGVQFVDGPDLVSERRVSMADIAPGNVSETLVEDNKPSASESEPLACVVDWVRVFETG